MEYNTYFFLYPNFEVKMEAIAFFLLNIYYSLNRIGKINPFIMSTKKKLLLFLLIVPGMLAEILSGNTPIMKLFNPVDFFFLVLAYGIPVVLIWDFQNRYKVSYLGLFCIGLAYGIFNE